MLRDLQYAARALRAGPAFTIASVVTLSLGIGASTAIFSVADAVLIRPLPYKDSARLVYACDDLRTRNVYDHLWSGLDYMDLRQMASGTLEDVAGVFTNRNTYQRADGTPEEEAIAQVTPNMFRVLGVRVVMGRDFTESDGLPDAQSPDGAPLPPSQRQPVYAIASWEFFQRRFAGNPAALGQPTAKNGPILVGVLEPGVELLFRPDKNIERKPDIWIATRLSPSAPRVAIFLRLIARLRPDATLERAQAQADVMAAHTRAVEPTYRGADFRVRLEPMQRYLVAQERPAILALMGAVIFLLLIACSNIANLFLVRASLRERDLAVRTAMGASWWRLARQMLAEALLIAAAGSALGLLLASEGVRQLVKLAPANLPRLDATRLNPAVLVFSMGAAVLAVVLFGLVPAFRAARPDVAQVLRSAGRASGLSGTPFMRNAVVAAEVALCFVLLVGAGLMFRSFLELQRIHPGYDPGHLLTFRTVGGKDGPTPADSVAQTRQLRDALEAIPGVEGVTAANILPLNGLFFPNRWGKEDAMTDFARLQSADLQTVMPGYFELMRTPLVAGRFFNQSDEQIGLRHAIVDQMLAAKAFPGGNAVGQRILSRINTPANVWYEIVGVVAHQRLSSLAEPGREQLYLPDGYFSFRAVQQWAVRTQGDPASYAAQVRGSMARVDGSMLVTDFQTMESIVGHAQTGTRFTLLLIGSFAAIAALLAGLGLYGVLSTVVRQRTAEIGVRMALGAAPSGIFGLMIAYGLRLSAIGVAAGMVAALALTQVMRSLLVGVKATDPLTFGAMTALFFAIAVLAAWIPARRAAALDPSTSLRES